jgi:hypothetical protein
MSNESENERIELTEFEGLGKGEQHPKHLFEEVEKRFNDGGVKTQPLYLDEAFVNAIIMLPDLITELKRTYEEIDDLKRQYRSCYQSLIDTTDWNVRMQNAIDSGKMSEIRRVRNS